MNYERIYSGMAPYTEKQPLLYSGMVNPYNNKPITHESFYKTYNRYTERFNSSNWRAEQEFSLDQRHKFFVDYCLNIHK